MGRTGNTNYRGGDSTAAYLVYVGTLGKLLYAFTMPPLGSAFRVSVRSFPFNFSPKLKVNLGVSSLLTYRILLELLVVVASIDGVRGGT